MMKGPGLASQGLIHAAQFATTQSSGKPHQLVPGFSYVRAAVQVKPAEQKQPAGEQDDVPFCFILQPPHSEQQEDTAMKKDLVRLGTEDNEGDTGFFPEMMAYSLAQPKQDLRKFKNRGG